MDTIETPDSPRTDPRHTLATWANDGDEWVRSLVRQVLATNAPLDLDQISGAYGLFRQEKSLDERTLPVELRLETEDSPDDLDEPLVITKVSEVHGVNAIASGSTIEPHVGLTILYGENGTGKTGYSRIFKALAASRTADTILGNVEAESTETLGAKVDYKIGDDANQFVWAGESGKAPFTRMSIFDSRAVNIHVDDDIEYVYTPSVLALFEYISGGLRGVQELMDARVRELKTGGSSLLSRFPRGSSVYPFIETLGAASDLETLKAKASTDPKVDEAINKLRSTVAALEANTFGLQISANQAAKRALEQGVAIGAVLLGFDSNTYNEAVTNHAALKIDYSGFRTQLFATADLPAEPDPTWEQFVRSGHEYEAHLESLGVHDIHRCAYCRQPLEDTAVELLKKYGEYIEDKISAELRAAKQTMDDAVAPVLQSDHGHVDTFLGEYANRDDKPAFYTPLSTLRDQLTRTLAELEESEAVSDDLATLVPPSHQALEDALEATVAALVSLKDQSDNRASALAERRTDLQELIAAAELTKSWTNIEGLVEDAKEAYRLGVLSKAVPALSRALTALAKTASNELVNNSFEELFLEECKSLRARELKLQFVGREGKAQRRKMIAGKYKPSKIFSEGEQKVLALADFLAEARLAGIAAPVIFDDPVSSLDHRRIDEVATRVARLAEDTQVIVFTHDILFATKLLSLFEVSKRCAYFHVTDEDGRKGGVTRASGPRWDSLSKIKGHINDSIQKAKAEEGEARAALVRTGYNWIRSWCEVFTEQELLQGVTQRLQPNVSMGRLGSIKVDNLPASFATVTAVFDEACRYIDGHSQPLATLAVAPTLAGLEADWQKLTDCQTAFRQA